MTKKRVDSDGTQEEGGLSRRQFFKAGAAGVAVAALSAPALAQGSKGPGGIEWDYDVDVLVLGGGCMGLPTAIRARDLGARVLVIDQNFDLGGRMLHSGGQISLGGGDPLQLRDIAGQADPEGFITVESAHTREELDEDPDHLFRDHVDWSIVDGAAQAPYRYNERDLHRAYADNCYATRLFLMENYVRMGRIAGTHGTGGMTRARRAVSFLMLGETTDIRAGTITRYDSGRDPETGAMAEHTSHFAPARMGGAGAVVGPDAVGAGSALSRCLEFSAREKGVQFMLNRRMTEIIREEPWSGRVIGVKASYTPRFDPETGEQLQSLWSNGNVDEQRETIHIRARKAVVVATGGHAGNAEFRSMFYPAFRDPAWGTSGQSLLGRGRGADGSGIKAAMRIGATLSGMHQNLSYPVTFHIPGRLATPDPYTDMYPGHPTFSERGSTGFSANANTFQHFIAVNQVGKRFFNDRLLMQNHTAATFPGGTVTPARGVDIVQGDWRNCSRDFVRSMYQKQSGIDAALAVNEGSQSPDFFSGPLWAIFDEAAVNRLGANFRNNLRYPFIGDNGYFFRADTIEQLANRIYAGHQYQRVPLTHLRQTIDTWNGYVDNGYDPEFGRGTGPEGDNVAMWRIAEPPFYAASIVLVWHDSYGGLRINGKCEVIDLEGQPIPGLYSGCEASGGGNQHGLGRGLVHGYIAGTQVMNQP